MQMIFHERACQLDLAQVLRTEEFSMPRNHFHNHLELYYLFRGERNYLIKNQIFCVGPGDLIIIPPHQVHRTSPLNSPVHERLLFQIDTALVGRLASQCGDPQLFQPLLEQAAVLHLEGETRHEIQWQFERLKQEMNERRIGYEGAIHASLTQLLLFVLRSRQNIPSLPDNATPADKKIQEVVAYISQHCTERLSLETISSEVFISKYRLCHLFKEVTGFTVNEYITISRMMRARELLLGTGMSVGAVARAVGFESNTHFSRIFHQCMGLPPLAYRKTHRSDKP